MLNQNIKGLASCLIHSVPVEPKKSVAPNEFC